MPDPLSAETLARMKRDHQRHPDGCCVTCKVEPYWGEIASVPFPCTPALLLAELERVTEGPDGCYGVNLLVREAVGLVSHCHCGRDGMEPAHPRHDG